MERLNRSLRMAMLFDENELFSLFSPPFFGEIKNSPPRR
jgi:hypothetical protein